MPSAAISRSTACSSIPSKGASLTLWTGWRTSSDAWCEPSEIRAHGSPRTSCGWYAPCGSRPDSISPSTDAPTLAAIDEMAETISVVSAERIAQEMRKMLVDPARAGAVELLRRTRLLEVLLPELTDLASASEGHSGVWEHTKQVLAGLLPDPSFSAALAALLHGIDERGEKADVSDATGESFAARSAAAIGERWRLSNKERELTAWLLEHHGHLAGADDQPWSVVQPLLIDPGAAELVSAARGRRAGPRRCACRDAQDKMRNSVARNSPCPRPSWIRPPCLPATISSRMVCRRGRSTNDCWPARPRARWTEKSARVTRGLRWSIGC